MYRDRDSSIKNVGIANAGAVVNRKSPAKERIKRLSTENKKRLRYENPYAPIYRAYRLRATATSCVPLMMARPSGKTVNS